MLYLITSMIGLLLGGFLAYVSPEEMEKGEKYFRIICYLVILGLITSSFFYSFNLLLLIIGVILGIIFYNEYFYFGIFSVSTLISGVGSLLTTILIFIYGLPAGSLLYYKKRYLGFLSNILLFFIPFALYFLQFNLTSFAAGGLIGVLVRKMYDRSLTKHKA